MDKEVFDVLRKAHNILCNENIYGGLECDAFENVLVAKAFIKLALKQQDDIGYISVERVKDQLRSQGELPEQQILKVALDPPFAMDKKSGELTRLEFPNGVKITFVHYDLPNWEYHDKDTRLTACLIMYRNSGKQGVSRCHPNDVYDRYKGEKIALRKALKDTSRCYRNPADINLDAENLEEMIKDKKFYQEIWRAFFKANGLNERGEK